MNVDAIQKRAGDFGKDDLFEQNDRRLLIIIFAQLDNQQVQSRLFQKTLFIGFLGILVQIGRQG